VAARCGHIALAYSGRRGKRSALLAGARGRPVCFAVMRAGEQVPGSPVMHDDGEPGRRSRVLDRDLAVGDPDELWWRAHSLTLPAAPGEILL
jgi:hypothetical protein